MKKQLDKPLLALVIIGLIAGAVIYYCFGIKVFSLVMFFWILLCHLWQNTTLNNVTWWEKMISVLAELCLWILSAGVCYGLSLCVNYIFGWQTAWLWLHFLRGAILYIIGWQLYKVGLVYKWWLDFKQYAFYVGSLLLTIMGGLFFIRNILL